MPGAVKLTTPLAMAHTPLLAVSTEITAARPEVAEAAIKACEATDAGLGELLAALATQHGRAVILADHGNAEQMWDPEINAPHTAHTLNLVEVFVVGDGFTERRVDGADFRGDFIQV